MWKPGVDYDQESTGRVYGWSRRFWQGSPDHRGTPEKPGRVVTLVPQADRCVTGRVYRLSVADLPATLRYLDHRESGGYLRCWLTVDRLNIRPVRALTYIALPGNAHYLGPAQKDEILRHIERSTGPSGDNIDYYHELISSMRKLDLGPNEFDDVELRNVSV